MSHLRRVAATLAATAVALSPSLLGSAGADTPSQLPHQDPFYSYSGSTPLAQVPAGTVLDQRAVTLTSGAAAEQLLYRTQDQQGHPSVTVTTVINPAGATNGIVGYLSYYDALGDQCDPSYTLQGGGSGPGSEALVINKLVSEGYAVTVPDFEGEDLHWVAGSESGWSTLDAVRASESYLHTLGDGAGTATKVGLIGYSGGSIAGEWASELAPAYAPELNLVGAAIGGIPVDLAHNLRYIDGSKTWSGVIPAALVSLSRAFGVSFAPYESAYGKQVTQQVSGECIGSFNGAYPGLHLADLLKSQYRDFLHIPTVADVLNQLIMGTAPGTPQIPMMMEVGNADGVGDGVMVTKDVEALAHEYCTAGMKVHLKEDIGADHTAAGSSFFLQGGISYLLGLMAGAPAQDDCATIPAGNDLSPIVATAGPWGRFTIHPALHARSHGGYDVLVVHAHRAVGATVKVFRLHHGHQTKVGHGLIDKHGKVTIKVADHNGSAKTRYRAEVAATATTLAATTRVVKQR